MDVDKIKSNASILFCICMWATKWLIILCILWFLGYGCQKSVNHFTTYKTERITIDSLFMQSENTYIAYVEQDKFIIPVKLECLGCLRLYTDVPKTEPMFALNKISSFLGDSVVGVDIHIHDLDDIEAGAWNKGKFGHGKNNKIE